MAQATGGAAAGADPHREGQETYERRAEARARSKLEAIREGRIQDAEVGRALGGFVTFIVCMGLLCLLWLLGAVGCAMDSSIGGPEATAMLLINLGVVLALAAVTVWGGIAIWKGSAPRTPQTALTAFYKALGHGKFDRAQALVLGMDFDDFPRYQPQIPKLGHPSGRVFPFAAPDAFSTYWSELLRAHTAPYCFANVKRLQITEVSEDVVVADFRLALAMNTQLYALLVLASPVIAVIVDLATRKRVTVDMRKILVRVGSEWHLWSGDWQGYEEFTTDWLPVPAPAGATPYRGADDPAVR